MRGQERSRRWASAAAALAAALAVCALGAADARAGFSAAQLVSASAFAQAEAATSSAAVSADGRYVVFATRARSLFADADPPGVRRLGGIFRKDLTTGALDLVALGNVYDGATPVSQLSPRTVPSVSADGRYVAFSTTARLSPQDANGVDDVYVRDMMVPADAPGAYQLASAVDGGEAGLTYASGGGAVAEGGALSDDGRHVAFTVVGSSNLAGGGADPETPAGQVAVRDLDARRTTLVTTQRGADGTPTATPVSGDSPSQATISGDASTVAWLDSATGQQVPLVQGENPSTAELLWRRIADPSAPTRRVTGIGDPDDPACASGGAVTPGTAPNPCNGPFEPASGDAPSPTSTHPSLTRDGTIVAFTGGEPRGAAVTSSGNGYPFDLWLADMRPGLSRKQATRRLTATAGNTDAAASSSVGMTAIAPDGSWLVFTTQRSRFPLSPPTPLGTFPDTGGATELYAIDMRRETLELVSHAFDGGPAPGAATSPSVADRGARIAFVSTGDALVYGDANGVADAFAVTALAPPADVSRTVLPPPPAPIALTPEWRLLATASSQRDGTVLLYAVVPGAGSVAVRAAAAVPLTRTRRVRKRVGRGRAARWKTVVARTTVVRRRTVVDVRARRAGAPGLVTARLRLSGRQATLARRRGGLAADATVRFTASGRRALTRTIPVRFRWRPAPKPRKPAAPSSKDTSSR